MLIKMVGFKDNTPFFNKYKVLYVANAKQVNKLSVVDVKFQW